jgi:hypothetical protein
MKFKFTQMPHVPYEFVPDPFERFKGLPSYLVEVVDDGRTLAAKRYYPAGWKFNKENL